MEIFFRALGQKIILTINVFIKRIKIILFGIKQLVPNKDDWMHWDAYKRLAYLVLFSGLLFSAIKFVPVGINKLKRDSNVYNSKKSNNYKILVLPFYAHSNKINGNVGSIISRRLRDIIKKDSLQVQVYYLESIKPSGNFGDSAIYYKDKYSADMVIYGDYSYDNFAKEDMVSINYFSDSYVIINSPNFEFQSCSEFDVSKGKFQTGIDKTIYYFSGLMCYNDKQYAKCINFLKKSLFVEQSIFMVSSSFEKLNMLDSAIIYYSTLINKHPNNWDAYFNRGNCYIKKKEYNKAVIDISKAISIDSRIWEAFYNRGYSYFQIEFYELALQDFSYIESNFQSKTKNVLIILGETYRGLKNYERAKYYYNLAIKNRINKSEAYKGLGGMYFNLEEYEASIKYYTQALRIAPNDFKPYYFRGMSYYYLNSFNLALDDLNQSIILDSTISEIYSNRALIYIKLDDLTSALNDLNNAIQVDPSYLPSYYSIGVVLENLDSIEAAIRDYSYYLSVNQNNKDVWLARAKVYKKNNQDKEAFEDLKRVITLDPKNAPALQLYGNILIDYHQYKEALIVLDKLIAINPKDARAFFLRGGAYFFLQEYDLAISDYKESERFYDNLTPEERFAKETIYSNLSECYYMKNLKQE